ncbi:alpha/beta fold hydrolase [Actinoplanes awajinensis]|uniref:AB hydrolase-1 domain-containing protein n=1 Tax=Actinoplanes awajinensis subsp. mycoplanecinus TaxID=135947 RepID=A0A117MQ54_9ACTN|nr:alpha/beta hydrolase [Actinoplanes awajinensis]KUL29679.1 hypothetical protein ADL15_26570 [Actinoplanes awajinensis subsp. mycoplanecinus]
MVKFTPRRPTVLRSAGLVTTALIIGLIPVVATSAPPAATVPPGARPGSVTMHACEYQTESGKAPADCGTLVVPENRRDPRSELIALPVIRVRATVASPAEPIFRLGGGPGATNMTFPQAGRLTGKHDVVLVGYRGVDGSRRLDCPEVTGTLESSADITGAKSQRAVTAAFRACATRLTGLGVDLTAYSVAQQVDDLEAARQALGYQRINLLSSSAGTRTAMVYSWRHPASLARSAMLSVNPPGHMIWDPAITDSQIDQYAQLCKADSRCSARTPDLAASMRSAGTDAPSRWGPLHIKNSTVRTVALYGMQMNGMDSAPRNAPNVIDAYLRAAAGDASGFWAMSALGDVVLPSSIVWGQFASFAMIDAPAAQRYYAAGGDPGSILRNSGSDFLWGGPAGYATVWPDSPDNAEYRTVRTSDVETLLVSGSVDFSTPAQLAARDLLPSLSRGRQVILPEMGHTGDIWEYQPEAGRHLLTTFFDTGAVDASHFVTQPVDFTPPALSMATIAKILLGVALGGAALALALLAGFARHVRRHGGFRPRAGLWLRILTPLPIGSGSWLLATLLVWTMLPSLAISGAVATILPVSLAVGIGAHLCWTRPDRSARMRRAGLSAAIGGATLGAVIGYGSADGIVAPLWAVLGAAAATNFALVALDCAAAARRRPLSGAGSADVIAGDPQVESPLAGGGRDQGLNR